MTVGDSGVHHAYLRVISFTANRVIGLGPMNNQTNFRRVFLPVFVCVSWPGRPPTSRANCGVWRPGSARGGGGGRKAQWTPRG